MFLNRTKATEVFGVSRTRSSRLLDRSCFSSVPKFSNSSASSRACEVQSYVINRQKAALDQRQQRRMIADAVRDVAGFRERGNCNEWKTGTQLIEIGALRRIRTGWIGSQRRAEQFRIGDAGIDGA